jgi:phosphoribosyl-ATP pyrophosphohydrolase
MSDADLIERLERVIESRMRERPESSYVAQLLAGGEPALSAKLREEAEELIAAALRGETVHEAADLVFHLLVLLASRGVQFAAVRAELERRFGTGGLAEKAARPASRGGA